MKTRELNYILTRKALKKIKANPLEMVAAQNDLFICGTMMFKNGKRLRPFSTEWWDAQDVFVKTKSKTV